MSYNVSRWLPSKMRTQPLCMRHCACACSRDPWVVGQKQLHFWNPRPRFAYSLYNFCWATTTIKCRLFSSITNAKALDFVNFLCVTLWPWPLYMVGHVPNAATKFEDPTTICSWVMSYNASHWLPLKMRMRPPRMCLITWPMNGGSKTVIFLESPTPICLFTIQLLLGSDND